MAVSRRSAHMNVMAEAAEKAGRALIRDFGEVEHLQVSKKGPGDFVSAADHKSEKLIVEILSKARPNFGFLLEEGGEKKGGDAAHRWIVDPLDGTSNFLHGIPHWCISIALEKDGEIVAGVVHDPIKNELFAAEKGTGAFMNNKRLRVSSRFALDASMIAMGGVQPGDAQKHATYISEINAVTSHVGTMRRFGAAALDLAYVAAGRCEAFWERNLSPWDVAAGALIIKEAGGSVTDLSGGKDYVYGRGILGSNGSVHAALLKLVQSPSVKARSAG